MLPGLAAVTPQSGIYTNNFGQYTTGVAPPDWTNRWAATNYLVQTGTGTISGKCLRWTKSANVRQAISWNFLPGTRSETILNSEILFRARNISTPTTPTNLMGGLLRGGGASGTETGYRCMAQSVSTGTSATAWNSGFDKYVSGTVTGPITPYTNGPSPNFAINTWYYMRMRINGNTLYRKIWYSGAAEPGSWDEILIDTSIATTGWIGLTNVSANPTMDIDFFGVSISGQTIPVPI